MRQSIERKMEPRLLTAKVSAGVIVKLESGDDAANGNGSSTRRIISIIQSVRPGDLHVSTYEHANQKHFFPKVKSKLPKQRYREPQDKQINNELHNTGRYPECFKVGTATLGKDFPHVFDRSALKEAQKQGDGTQNDREESSEPQNDPEPAILPSVEYSCIETESRKFGERDGENPGDPSGHKKLEVHLDIINGGVPYVHPISEGAPINQDNSVCNEEWLRRCSSVKRRL